ncbi:beta-lactamase/transpeptidase-like protein [Pholiota conissans]|uniref:Beta-lactamase/transpeptidase-like protein n=1 Tax=Pholiota conissans TaxID=109636 RepID=A0A9P5Z9I1_9AGAR|nr:beta-lactamase/transpeptidase-like protein [Pholiota conissans]
MVALTDSGKKALDAVVERLDRERKMPGFVLGATTAKEEVYFNSGGNKVVDDPTSDKVGPEAVFWICSMTKLIAHIAALQLIDQGKLTADTPVSEIFPQFANLVIVDNIMFPNPNPNPTFKPATNIMLVKHLLNFSSGLFYPWTQDFGYVAPHAYLGVHDTKDPHAIIYGYGSDLLGFIVEKITVKTLDEYLQENVFKPLNITASFYLTGALRKNLLPLTLRTPEGQMHFWKNQPGTAIIEQDPGKVSHHFGGIGLYTSLRDYLKLLRHLLQILEVKADRPVLTKKAVESLFIGTHNDEGVKNLSMVVNLAFPGQTCQWSSALAATTEDWENRRKKGCAFWSGWAGTHFFIDPRTGVAAVYGTQLLAPTCGNNDPENLKGFVAFEEALYAGLDKN